MAGSINFGSVTKRDDKIILTNTSSTSLDSEALIKAQLIPLEEKIKNTDEIITQNTKKLAALSELRSILSRLKKETSNFNKDLIKGPRAISIFDAKKVEIFNNDSTISNNYLEATANENVTTGSYEVEVINLASTQKQTTSSFTDPMIDITGSGPGKFAVGSFQINSNDPSLTPVSITITAGDNLYKISNKINEIQNKINLKSYIIKAGNNDYRLVIESTKTGTINGYNISDPAHILSNINFTYNSPQNVNIKFNSINISNPTNIIESIINGLTLNIKKITPNSVKISVNIESDYEKIIENFLKFQTEYNKFIEFYQSQTARQEDDPHKYKEDALLYKDFNLIKTKDKLHNILISLINNGSTKLNNLGSIGINISSSLSENDIFGNSEQKISENMVINFDYLQKNLIENFDLVRSLFDIVYNSTNPNINIAGTSDNININQFKVYIDYASPDSLGKVRIEYRDNNNLVNVKPEYNMEGEGNLLITGAKFSPLDGLKILYTHDGTILSEATVNLSQGVADKIKNLLDSVLGNFAVGEGSLKSSENNILKDNESQKKIKLQQQSKLKQEEGELTKKYAKLQTTLSGYEKQLELMKSMDRERRSNK